jgi:purine-binding chemotaxis protein CheW
MAAAATLEREASARRVCLFRLGERLFAVDVAAAREIVVLEGLTRVPLAPAHLAGVANLRGRVLPIADVRGLLGLPPGRIEPGTSALVVEADGWQAAIGIDGLLGLDTLEEAPAVDGEQPEPLVLGRLRRDGGSVRRLDVPRVLHALRVWSKA